MSVLWFLLFLCSIFFTSSGSAQQHYDSKDCAADSTFPGSRYTCNRTNSCETFLIFRANQHLKTLETLSNLLRLQQINSSLQNLNRIASNTTILQPGREIFVPVTCSCSGQYFQTDFSYTANKNTTVADVACSVFESLVTYHTIMHENQLLGSQDHISAGTKLHIPLKCACPDKDSIFKFLATYPVFEGDMLSEISDKFGVSSEDLFTVNGLDQHWQTIFPNTTLLIPFKSFVLVNQSHSPPPPPPPPTPMFLPTITVSSGKDSNFKSYYIAGSVVGFFLVVTAMFAYSLYVKKSIQKENKVQKLLSFNTKSSTQLTCSTPKSSATTPPCLSPDLLVGIIYSLKSYNIEELRKATNDFSQKIGSDDAYRGVILNIDGGLEPIMVKPLRFEDIRQVIDVHSRINHINIVTLVGVCYGESDAMSTSYILLELPSNGCLRDCISKIRWQIRTQIAFDIASGLHYLHDCIFPSYAHMSVSSRNVSVTSDWRAKLTNIRITNSASEKVDIFAFGVVLLELISGREDENGDGKSFKESLVFLGGGGGGEGGCFEQLRSFIDPCLEGDYPLAEALCLAVLAKTCVEDDPLHRPSMDDILKVLVRMV